MVRMGDAIKSGFRAGCFPGVMVMVVYFALHHDLDMPWLKIAGLMALYAPVVGISLAAAIELVVMLVEHWLVTIVGAALAGAACGIAPGAFGVVVFGAYKGPFIGTSLIATSTIAGALLVALPAAMRARGDRRLRPVVMATVIATVIIAVAATVVAPLLVDGAFVRVQGALDQHGLGVGGAVGALGGGILGMYVGLVVVLARGKGRRPV